MWFGVPNIESLFLLTILEEGQVVSISTVIKKLKGITARKLFLEFPDIKKKLWNGSLWSPSYYVGTAEKSRNILQEQSIQEVSNK